MSQRIIMWLLLGLCFACLLYTGCATLDAVARNLTTPSPGPIPPDLGSHPSPVDPVVLEAIHNLTKGTPIDPIANFISNIVATAAAGYATYRAHGASTDAKSAKEMASAAGPDGK